MSNSATNHRGVAWGTVTAGMIALLTVAAIGLVAVGGITIPFRTAGPGAIIVVGVLILLAGLFLVIRSNARQHRKTATAPVPPAPAPLDATQTPVLGARYEESSPLDVTMPEATQTAETTEIPAAQGSAGDPPDRGHDGGSEAQSSH